ncbi:hypothetical protein O6H91_02G144200 [Diphasiastrum complanatum]|uniref:Uncharacterized protein n=2 Tax=Diphasiastrum complanatum TaxID=34168 RepID=A0ACC2ELX6_DIPCM|nr:hypothetical protein O6H91_02G144200 [Diphasiastrum complanatum]KAJ7567377.1 hypothetical protein O6H91_02G144200 [Diphasiastrum complanatum]
MQMTRNIFKVSRKHLWQSCSVWQLWLEGLFGFGLLMSCHMARAYRLYHIFVGRRLPPLKSYQLLPLLLLPWLLAATVIQATKGVRNLPECDTSLKWRLLIIALHVSYPTVLIASAWRIRNIPFQFNEFKDLVKGVFLCFVFLGLWGALYVAKKVEEQPNEVLVLTGRFLFIVTGDGFLLFMFLIPILDPFRRLLRKRSKFHNFDTMGQVLKVPPSGVLNLPMSAFSFDQALESLLHHKKFRLSFLAFADSRMAGENVHFFDEVRELSKIPSNNTVQRIYMVDHIIESYIKTGSPMEINISHQMRSEILGTKDLADSNLFKSAVKEALKMMELNLLKEYWHSTFFLHLKEEIEADAQIEYVNSLEQELSSKKHYDPLLFSDNPFDQLIPFSDELKVKGNREVISRNDESAGRFYIEMSGTSLASSEMPSSHNKEPRTYPMSFSSTPGFRFVEAAEFTRDSEMHSRISPRLHDRLSVNSSEIDEGNTDCATNQLHSKVLSNSSK